MDVYKLSGKRAGLSKDVLRLIKKLYKIESDAKASAVIYSIIETCKANKINSYKYLCHILSKLKEIELECKNNPDLMGWVADYDDAGGGKTNAAITVMQAAINSKDYEKWMLGNGFEGTMKSMEQYLYYRNGIINILNQVEGSINNVDNYQIKVAWENIRQELKNNDVRWAEISDLYLTGDDDPRNPGNAYEVLLAEQGVIEYGS